jgi:DNA polymerase III epsilon subunit-like protein
MKFKLPKHLLIIDTETSGTDETASIIQLGAVIFHKDGYLMKEIQFDEYIIPYTLTWDEKAYKVHKIEQSFLAKKGRHLKDVLEIFEVWASSVKIGLKQDYYLAQWGCGFDTTMLQNAYNYAKKEYPFHYRSFDIGSIVRFELARKGLLSGRKMGENVCAKKLGIEVNESKLHNGLYDAYLSGLMLEKIIQGK